MQKLSSNQIRQLWLDFFQKHDHLVLPSKSLVPDHDPSLLLINSGVATLKDYFANKKTPPAANLVNSQKCIRTNDIENVGKTARHLTFFEMLGNFSIGNYFKEHAIALAYDFIFNVLKIPKNKIYITYHHQDTFTYEQWLKVGIADNHLIKGDDKTNFWDVGKGPCGYDTEIFYDRGSKFDSENHGIKLLEKDIDNDRYLEIWNIVFSEFNNDGHNNYSELNLKNIDTGAGLERIVSIFQNGATNFDTDLFLPIIEEITKITQFRYDPDNYFVKKTNKQTEINKYFKIISDHMRAITMAINDGVKPSNTARGYIIRKLIRRAYRAGVKLEINQQTFLHHLVAIVAKTLPIYSVDVKNVAKIIAQEEIVFARTIKQGEELLLKTIAEKKALDSKIAWKLFETYGYPLDLTIEIAHEHNIELDLRDFERLKQEHAKVSRQQHHNGMEMQLQVIQQVEAKISQFIGYDNLQTKSQLLLQGNENEQNYSLFAQTPFYATSGGQACDHGEIDNQAVLEVFKDRYGNHWHVTKAPIKQTEQITLTVNEKTRLQAMQNHSATHILGRAIYDVLGYTTQLGSENNPQKLRLDFPAQQRPSDETIQAIENRVNYYIKQKLPREYLSMTKREAINMGAWVLEKEAQASTYDDIVRVVNFANISVELCGGTHVKNSHDIEKFKIIRVESKGSGTYRIEAITSFATIANYEKTQIIKYQTILENIIQKNQTLNPSYQLSIPQNLTEINIATTKAKEDYKKLLKVTKQPKKLDDLNINFVTYQEKPAYINLQLENLREAKSLALKLREKYPDKLIIVGFKDDDKQTVIIASQTYDSNAILQGIIAKHHGRGGGQKTFAMGQTNIFNNL